MIGNIPVMIGNIPIMIGMLVGMLSYHRTHPTSDNAEWELLNSLKKNSLDAFFFRDMLTLPGGMINKKTYHQI